MEKQKWAIEKSMINARAANSDQIVRLNVGGNRKEVSKELLTKVKGSLMESTFGGKHQLKAVDEHIFLDRDSRVFDMLLNYLRHEGNYVPKKIDEETKTLF